MKKILFALSMFMMVGVAANAQKCAKGANKACCAKKATAATTASDVAPATRVASAMTEADVIADQDENITARVCSMSGTKSYYMKSVCEKSGAVSWDEAQFCDKSKKFTKVASVSMEKNIETGEVKDTSVKAKKECTKGAKACCASKKKVG